MHKHFWSDPLENMKGKMMVGQSNSDTLLEVTIDADLKLKLKYAAEIRGCSVNDFVNSTLQVAVNQVTESPDMVRLSAADQMLFAQALLEPKEPAPALSRAFERRKKILKAE